MQAVIDAISDFAQWVYDTIVEIFTDFGEFFHDLAVWAFDGILSAMADVFISIPVPDFLVVYSLDALFQGLHPTIAYFASALNISQALGIIAAGYSARMGRKMFKSFF